MNRLNKTEPAVFKFCRFYLFLKDSFFQIINLVYIGNRRTSAKISNGILAGLKDQAKIWITPFFIVLLKKVMHENRQ